MDLASALSSWDDYRPITENYQRLGHSGIQYRIAAVPVDVMPFGPVLERPPGVITPPPRNEGWTVVGFQDVYRSAQQVPLEPGGSAVRVPSPAGYVALKMRSWAVRTKSHDTKDAQDLAVACSRYINSPIVEEQLYELGSETELLLAYAMDQDLAAVALLPTHVVETLSVSVRNELAADWRASNLDTLSREFTTGPGTGWTSDRARRKALLDALASALE